MTNLYDELQWRGLLYDATEGMRDVFGRERVTAYIGFDPTASSLHVGSLLPLMALARLQRFGHSPIAIVGGGTGLIGDPKPTTERALLTSEQVDENVAGLRGQLSRFLDFEAPVNPARLVNNADWLTGLGAVAFMRDVGKHFSVNALLAKEAIRRRVESGEGISYTEFSYPLLQAYDFLELYRRFGCTLQMGGSDQWGNITAGLDFIRRVEGPGARVHGLVMPLITTSSGTKFGKSEAGAVWLDPAQTSPYAFYQFWLNTDDRDVVAYLKYFTFLDREAIDALERAHAAAPGDRAAHRALAREVTTLVHGGDEAARAERGAERLFAGDLASATAADLRSVLADVPSTTVTADDLDRHALSKWIATTGLASSASEATRLIRGGGIYVNDARVTDDKKRLTRDDAIGGEVIVLARGARQKHVLKLAPAERLT